MSEPKDREQRALELAKEAVSGECDCAGADPRTYVSLCGTCKIWAAIQTAILQAMDEERERALEEAAKLIDEDIELRVYDRDPLAAAIRSLKNTTTPEKDGPQ